MEKEIALLTLKQIVARSDLQMRERFDEQAIARYAEIYAEALEDEDREEETDPLPPPVVFDAPQGYLLADGFHRTHAAERAGYTSLYCEIREGTLADARLYALGANTSHGVRRTDDDLRRAVRAALHVPELASLSNRELARIVDCSPHSIARGREELGLAPSTRVNQSEARKPEPEPEEDREREKPQEASTLIPDPPSGGGDGLPATSSRSPDLECPDVEDAEERSPASRSVEVEDLTLQDALETLDDILADSLEFFAANLSGDDLRGVAQKLRIEADKLDRQAADAIGADAPAG